MKFSFWNFVAGFYDRLFSPMLNSDIPAICELASFEKADLVLDYGGGTGRVALAIRGKVARVIVLDAASKMIAEACLKELEGEVVSGLPTHFEAASCDKIIVIESFHHLPNQDDHLKEFWRLLKPDGVLLIEEPNLDSAIKYFLWLEHGFRHFPYWTADTWRAKLLTAGFLVQTEKIAGSRYFVKAKKIG